MRLLQIAGFFQHPVANLAEHQADFQPRSHHLFHQGQRIGAVVSGSIQRDLPVFGRESHQRTAFGIGRCQPATPTGGFGGLNGFRLGHFAQINRIAQWIVPAGIQYDDPHLSRPFNGRQKLFQRN